jgi:murein DD-endopeptidase MepM/ murein hydrolase activator NlpD
MAIYKEPFDKKLRGDEFGNMASYRKHPHRGQDWHPAEKTIIPAITAGKVTQIFWSDVLGNVVEILGEDGVYAQYCHLAAKPQSIKVGDQVSLGQPIGRVGGGHNTPSGSASTGAHLHLGMSKVKNGHLAPYDKLIDPIKHILKNLAGAAPAVPKPVAPAPAEPAPVVTPAPAVKKPVKPKLVGEIKKGSEGSAVRYLQTTLGVTGDEVGFFGTNTHKAVVALQKKAGLKADGIVGPLTWKALG